MDLLVKNHFVHSMKDWETYYGMGMGKLVQVEHIKGERFYGN